MLALCAVFAAPLVAAEDPPETLEPTADRRPDVLYGEPVKRIYAPKIDSWAVVDNQRLVLYATPFRPYLVTLKRPVRNLRWEYKIGLNNRSSYIDAKFDRIYVDGFPYAIERIEKLERETARALLGRDRRDKPEADEGEEQDAEQESADEDDAAAEGG